MGIEMVSKFLKEEDGQTTTEYVLILAVVVTIFMQFRRNLLAIVKKLFVILDRETEKAYCPDPDNCQ